MTNAARHLFDSRPHRFSDPNYKPWLNPSRFASFEWCPRIYNWKYVKLLDAPSSGFTEPMIQGSLYHTMAEAYDKGIDAWMALERKAAEMRTDGCYEVKWSVVIDYLQDEIYKKWFPLYKEFWDPLTERYEIISLEKAYHAEFPSFHLITKPDKVVRDLETGLVWVVERKTTKRDDSQWANKWRMNMQTTAEVIAVEKNLDEIVAGVYLEPVVVTRRKSKTWSWNTPQPIANFTHYPWRPVPKPDFIRREWERWAEDKVAELKWRYQTGREWEGHLLHCGDCRMNKYCSGLVKADDNKLGLVPISDDYVTEAQASHSKAGGKP